MSLAEDIKLENRRIRAFRILTDITLQRLCVERMTGVEAREAVNELRKTASSLFPGKEHVFDLVIAPRLDRVIIERFGSSFEISN